MAAPCATRVDPAIRAMYERPVAAGGKPKMLAPVACMRELLNILNGHGPKPHQLGRQEMGTEPLTPNTVAAGAWWGDWTISRTGVYRRPARNHRACALGYCLPPPRG